MSFRCRQIHRSAAKGRVSLKRRRNLMHHRIGVVSIAREGDRAITPRQRKHLRTGVEIECSAGQATVGRED